MSDSPKDASIIVNSLAAQIEARDKMQAGIQKTLDDFITAADTQIQKLVETNTLGPDTADDMLALNKATIQKTLDIIKAMPVLQPTVPSDKK